MGWRKGYGEEYKVKKKLEAEHGKGNVIKLAIAQHIGADFEVWEADSNKIKLMVEVKGFHPTKKNKYKNFDQREKEQQKMIMAFAEKHKVTYELWIVKPRQPIQKILVMKDGIPFYNRQDTIEGD